MHKTLFPLEIQQNSENNDGPLAHRLRPTCLTDFMGQKNLFEEHPFLRNETLSQSLILWGPPGTGKTTLAHILANNSNLRFVPFSAVLGGVNELRVIIDELLSGTDKTKGLIFIDEIHRFNKAQQDALLPYVETGAFILVGATTEYPKRTVNKALLSRCHTVQLKKLEGEDIKAILNRAIKSENYNDISQEMVSFVSVHSDGDARKALNALELLAKKEYVNLSESTLKRVILEGGREYDKNSDRHYDVISAFIKSMRGSDPQAAILWLAVMIDGGEDIEFIARRLVIFASEDIGNADPRAISIATSALISVQNIGLPEARIPLAQATTYLASTVKSNASYTAINEALEFVKMNSTLEVPRHLKNQDPEGKKQYLYPHNYPGNFVKQKYTIEKIPKFYRPGVNGQEKFLKERLDVLTGEN